MRKTLLKKLECCVQTKVAKASNCTDCRSRSDDLSKVVRLRYLHAFLLQTAQRKCINMINSVWLFSQFPVDLVKFTKEILNGKLHFCAVTPFIVNYDFSKTSSLKCNNLIADSFYRWLFCSPFFTNRFDRFCVLIWFLQMLNVFYLFSGLYYKQSFFKVMDLTANSFDN